MIQKNNIQYARGLFESIDYALKNIEANRYGAKSTARTEAGYLAEKIGKLYDLHFVEK